VDAAHVSRLAPRLERGLLFSGKGGGCFSVEWAKQREQEHERERKRQGAAALAREQQ